MPVERERSIIRVGNSYAITIPKGWVDRLKRVTKKKHKELKVRVVADTSILIEAIVPEGTQFELSEEDLRVIRSET